MEKHTMKQPRVAVYLCGQWRGSSYGCSKYLNKLFENFNCDFFIHTWDFYNGKEMFSNLPSNINHKISSISDAKLYYHTEDDVNRIKQSYPHVVYFEIETKEKNKQNDRDFGDKVQMSSFNQFYCAYRCNEYRKIYENMNGIRYDIIIKIRPDIIFPQIHIMSIKQSIDEILKDKNIIFSKYQNRLNDIRNKLPHNLTWDYYTFSSPFGMDCMMEWVRDVIDGKDVYPSDYILKYNLNPNPILPKVLFPNPTIIREIFKFLDLNCFYQEEFCNKWHPSHKKNLVQSMNEILYTSPPGIENERKLFFDMYNIHGKLIELFNPNDIVLKHGCPEHAYFTESQLKEFAHHLQSKQDEYETRINNL